MGIMAKYITCECGEKIKYEVKTKVVCKCGKKTMCYEGGYYE